MIFRTTLNHILISLLLESNNLFAAFVYCRDKAKEPQGFLFTQGCLSLSLLHLLALMKGLAVQSLEDVGVGPFALV